MTSFVSTIRPADATSSAPAAAQASQTVFVWLKEPGTGTVAQYEANDELLVPLMNRGYVQVAQPTEVK